MANMTFGVHLLPKNSTDASLGDSNNKWVIHASSINGTTVASGGAATQSANGLMSAADKTKLDGIAAGAQVNPGNATTSAAGLMSSTDKIKLDNYYELGQISNLNISDRVKNSTYHFTFLSGASNAPVAASGHGYLYTPPDMASYGLMKIFIYSDQAIYTRKLNNGTYGNWQVLNPSREVGAITYKNGWSSNGTSKLEKYGKVVCLNFTAREGTRTAGTVMANIAEGYRPENTVYVMNQTDQKWMSIATNGDIILNDGNPTPSTLIINASWIIA